MVSEIARALARDECCLLAGEPLGAGLGMLTGLRIFWDVGGLHNKWDSCGAQ